MSASSMTDAARLTLMLNDLRLPTIKAVWSRFTDQADQEGWPAARLLATLAEHELAERARRRLERHLTDARLPPGKTLDSFDFTAVPMVAQAQVMALTSGDRWLDEGANLILFGPPGGGKSHLAAAIGLALVEAGYRVLYTRTTDLVQRAAGGPSGAHPRGRHRQARQVPSVLIRLTPRPTRCSESGFSGVKLSVGGSADITGDAEQGAEGVERIEAAVEAKRELVEIRL